MSSDRKARALKVKEYQGYRAQAGGQTLQSWTVGALPLVNRLLERIALEAFLEQHLPPDDPRLEVPTACGLLLLVRNILLSREPIYGLGEWAERYAPDLLGLTDHAIREARLHTLQPHVPGQRSGHRRGAGLRRRVSADYQRSRTDRRTVAAGL